MTFKIYAKLSWRQFKPGSQTVTTESNSEAVEAKDAGVVDNNLHSSNSSSNSSNKQATIMK